jgi:hypothetical protein
MEPTRDGDRGPLLTEVCVEKDLWIYREGRGHLLKTIMEDFCNNVDANIMCILDLSRWLDLKTCMYRT